MLYNSLFSKKRKGKEIGGDVTFTPSLPRFFNFLSGLYEYVSYPRFLLFATYTSAPAMAMAAMTQSP